LHIYDFWSKRYQHVTDPELVFTDIPAHGCKLVRICGVGAPLQLVGDTLHISQGAEIASIHLEDEKLVVETVDMGRRVEGELWFWLPNAPKTATCNGEPVVIEDKTEDIYALHLQFTGKGRVEVVI
jgi:hypothetical protein